MSTLKQRIVELLAQQPGLSDRQITDALLGLQIAQQPVNQACRSLEAQGVLTREKIPGRPVGNYLCDGKVGERGRENSLAVMTETALDLSEDAVKDVLERWLRSAGWTVTVAWGHTLGTDIEAHRGNWHWFIEVKGSGSRPQMRINYFLAMLGELLQRMSEADAKYSIALPDMPQYRGLWKRLPALAKSRTGITALFIAENGIVTEID